MHKQYIVGTQKNRLNEDQNCLKIIFMMVPCKTLITCKKGKKKADEIICEKVRSMQRVEIWARACQHRWLAEQRPRRAARPTYISSN